MKDLIKYAALGIGGFMLLKQFMPAATSSSNVQATTSGGGAQTPTQQQASTPPPSTSEVDLQRAAANAGWASMAKGQKLNFHQWNYYRRLYAPTLAAPAPEDVGVDGSKLITAEEYHAALAAKGLAGLVMRAAAWGR